MRAVYFSIICGLVNCLMYAAEDISKYDVEQDIQVTINRPQVGRFDYGNDINERLRRLNTQAGITIGGSIGTMVGFGAALGTGLSLSQKTNIGLIMLATLSIFTACVCSGGMVGYVISKKC